MLLFSDILKKRHSSMIRFVSGEGNVRCYFLPAENNDGGFIYTSADRNKGSGLSFYKRINPYIHLQRRHFLKIPIWFPSLEEVFLMIKKADRPKPHWSGWIGELRLQSFVLTSYVFHRPPFSFTFPPPKRKDA